MEANKLLIAGDLYLPANIKYENTNSILDPELVELFANSNFNIVNLEAPILEVDESKKTTKITKTGRHIRNHNHAIDILKNLNINLLTLANNHILDYGEHGLLETIEKCKINNFDIVGVGSCLEEASKIYYQDLQDQKIAIINITENEWSIAGDKSAGANPLDIIQNVYKIKEAKDNSDYVILIIHGGHETYNLPSPRMVNTYRFFIDQGADAIIGHHTHCYSGYEIYKDSPIFYSLGNFIFPKKNQTPGWYKGFVLELELEKGKLSSFKLHPYKQSEKETSIYLMDENEKKDFEAQIDNLNTIISDKKKLKDSWDNFIALKMPYTLSIFSLNNIIPNRKIRAIIKRTWLNKIFLKKKFLIRLLNFIRCESHLDISINCLSKHILKDENSD